MIIPEDTTPFSNNNSGVNSSSCLDDANITDFEDGSALKSLLSVTSPFPSLGSSTTATNTSTADTTTSRKRQKISSLPEKNLCYKDVLVECGLEESGKGAQGFEEEELWEDDSLYLGTKLFDYSDVFGEYGGNGLNFGMVRSNLTQSPIALVDLYGYRHVFDEEALGSIGGLFMGNQRACLPSEMGKHMYDGMEITVPPKDNIVMAIPAPASRSFDVLAGELPEELLVKILVLHARMTGSPVAREVCHAWHQATYCKEYFEALYLNLFEKHLESVPRESKRFRENIPSLFSGGMSISNDFLFHIWIFEAMYKAGQMMYAKSHGVFEKASEEEQKGGKESSLAVLKPFYTSHCGKGHLIGGVLESEFREKCCSELEMREGMPVDPAMDEMLRDHLVYLISLADMDDENDEYFLAQLFRKCQSFIKERLLDVNGMAINSVGYCPDCASSVFDILSVCGRQWGRTGNCRLLKLFLSFFNCLYRRKWRRKSKSLMYLLSEKALNALLNGLFNVALEEGKSINEILKVFSEYLPYFVVASSAMDWAAKQREDGLEDLVLCALFETAFNLVPGVLEKEGLKSTFPGRGIKCDSLRSIAEPLLDILKTKDKFTEDQFGEIARFMDIALVKGPDLVLKRRSDCELKQKVTHLVLKILKLTILEGNLKMAVFLCDDMGIVPKSIGKRALCYQLIDIAFLRDRKDRMYKVYESVKTVEVQKFMLLSIAAATQSDIAELVFPDLVFDMVNRLTYCSPPINAESAGDDLEDCVTRSLYAPLEILLIEYPLLNDTIKTSLVEALVFSIDEKFRTESLHNIPFHFMDIILTHFSDILPKRTKEKLQANLRINMNSGLGDKAEETSGDLSSPTSITLSVLSSIPAPPLLDELDQPSSSMTDATNSAGNSNCRTSTSMEEDQEYDPDAEDALYTIAIDDEDR
eukprot:Nk52_evm1s744 gene=Nk52_evmTU1s744